jgi:hypothetical protein
VVNVRAKGDKIAVWLEDGAMPDSVIRIGKMIKKRLGMDDKKTINFNVHKEEKTKPGGKRKFVV